MCFQGRLIVADKYIFLNLIIMSSSNFITICRIQIKFLDSEAELGFEDIFVLYYSIATRLE